MLLTLIDKSQESTDCFSFIFKPEQPFIWQSGQYLRYYIDNPNPDQRGTGRFFTIASAPYEGVVMLTTRFANEDGSSFKKDLNSLSIGTQIEVTGPHGQFVVDDPNKNYVFIAGGIGITPFRSILLNLDHQGDKLNIILLYANRNNEIVYKEELDYLSQKHPEFKIYYIIDPNKINEELIKQKIKNIQKQNYYISGPKPMVEAIDQMLENLGIGPEKIKNDFFPGYN